MIHLHIHRLSIRLWPDVQLNNSLLMFLNLIVSRACFDMRAMLTAPLSVNVRAHVLVHFHRQFAGIRRIFRMCCSAVDYIHPVFLCLLLDGVIQCTIKLVIVSLVVIYFVYIHSFAGINLQYTSKFVIVLVMYELVSFLVINCLLSNNLYLFVRQYSTRLI